MKRIATPLLAAALALAGQTSQSQTILATGHTDVGIGYDTNLSGAAAWDLHIHKELPLPDEEFEPDEALFLAGPAASNAVPANPLFGFLGAPGAPVWILPQTANSNLLFLGIGAEEIGAGIFAGNTVTLTLTSISGPGNFFLYTTDGFGTPTVQMNSSNGLSSVDSVILAAGGHEHYNWAFTAPGTYELRFTASGTLAPGSVFTQSAEALYTFVIPEPGAATGLLALATLGAAAWSRKKRKRV